jgi:transposase
MLLHDLDESEWRVVRKFIPNACSAKELEDGVIQASVNGILWRMRTGEPWRLTPREYGDHTSIFRRFTRWRDTGVWCDVTMTLANVRNCNGLSDTTGGQYDLSSRETGIRTHAILI